MADSQSLHTTCVLLAIYSFSGSPIIKLANEMGKKRGNHSRLFDWTESLEIRKYVLVPMIKHATIVILFSFHHIAVLTSSKDGGLPGALHFRWVDGTPNGLT